tara:strand:- start:2766 stop:3146 length:381 start_codon:yes stop_codon:yes gene_type:complete
MKKKLIMLDMTCDPIHHGHIRLIKKASKLGKVIIATPTDKELIKHKKKPILKMKFRKEILQSIKYVYKVISSPYFINDKFLIKNKINFLIHGSDNRNNVSKNKLKIFPRTKNISSTLIVNKIKNKK